MTLTCEFSIDWVKINHHADYVDQTLSKLSYERIHTGDRLHDRSTNVVTLGAACSLVNSLGQPQRFRLQLVRLWYQ